MADLEQERALIAGFKSGGMAELPFVEAVRPCVRAIVKKRYARLWPSLEDLSSEVLLALFTMRDKKDPEDPIDPPLFELIGRLLNPIAKAMARDRARRAPVEDAEALAGAHSPAEASVEARQLAAFVERLPEEQAAVLVHQAAAVSGEGPALHEALGVTPTQARMRLAYAKELLFDLVYPEVNDG